MSCWWSFINIHLCQSGKYSGYMSVFLLHICMCRFKKNQLWFDESTLQPIGHSWATLDNGYQLRKVFALFGGGLPMVSWRTTKGPPSRKGYPPHSTIPSAGCATCHEQGVADGLPLLPNIETWFGTKSQDGTYKRTLRDTLFPDYSWSAAPCWLAGVRVMIFWIWAALTATPNDR